MIIIGKLTQYPTSEIHSGGCQCSFILFLRYYRIAFYSRLNVVVISFRGGGGKLGSGDPTSLGCRNRNPHLPFTGQTSTTSSLSNLLINLILATSTYYVSVSWRARQGMQLFAASGVECAPLRCMLWPIPLWDYSDKLPVLEREQLPMRPARGTALR